MGTVRLARRRLRGVDAVLAVDLVEVLRLAIVGLELLVAERPGGRDAAVMAQLTEVLPAQPQEGRAIDLRVAAYVVAIPG